MFDEKEEVVTSEQAVETPQPESAPEQKDPKIEKEENNIRLMRAKWEREKQEREKAEQRARELEERYSSMQQPTRQSIIQSESAPSYEFQDDEVADGKMLKNVATSVEKKIEEKYERKFQEMYSHLEKEQARNIMRRDCADFDTVLNDDNIKTFEALYPDEAQAIAAIPNAYSKFKAAYNMFKNYGIVERKQAHQSPAYEQGKPSRPANTPKSAASATNMSSPTTTPLTVLPDMEGRVVLTKEQMDWFAADNDRILRKNKF